MLASTRTRLAGALVIAVILAFALARHLREARFRTGFVSVSAGDSRELVLRRMGSPTEETDGTIAVHGGSKPPADLTAGCVSELWYTRFWSPERFAVCLDVNGRVLTKFHYASY